LFIGKDRDGSSQELRMDTVATRLGGGALIWYETLRAKTELEGKVLRWDEVIPKFIERFEGQDNVLLYEQELELLTYRRGKCKDLYKLEADLTEHVARFSPLGKYHNIPLTPRLY
jgi:hypothetical protein